MHLEWDYTHLADAYCKRAEYSEAAIQEMLRIASMRFGDKVCDIGAGTGNLTAPLARFGLNVDAVEPNDAMAAHGRARTKDLPVQWFKATAEESGRADGTYDLVTFGSSFNVTDRNLALREAARICRPRGWFACMWNHRVLQDPWQQVIEGVIRDFVPDYDPGVRREGQVDFLLDTSMFSLVHMVAGRIDHQQSIADCVEAWRSHATLARQAREKFTMVCDAIALELEKRNAPDPLTVPYVTRIWMGRFP